MWCDVLRQSEATQVAKLLGLLASIISSKRQRFQDYREDEDKVSIQSQTVPIAVRSVNI